MEPLTLDYVGAVTTYTPLVMVILQTIKQSPKVDNRKLPYYAILLGVVFAVALLVVGGKILWTQQGFYFDPSSTFKGIVEGIFGGAAGPSGYFLQKQLPINILSPGPDNYTQKSADVVQTPRPTQSVQVPPPPPPLPPRT